MNAARERGFVYVLMSIGMSTPVFKIGKTNNLLKRTKLLGIQMPFETAVACVIYSNKVYETEASLHRRFHGQRMNGEWFLLSNDDLQELKSLSIASSVNCPEEFFKQASDLRATGSLVDQGTFCADFHHDEELQVDWELVKVSEVDYALGNF